MPQLIKIKKPYRYYVQLTAAALSVLLCSYVLSVSASELPDFNTSLPKPAELSVLSKKSLSEIAPINKKSLQLGLNLSKKLLINHSDIKWQIQRDGSIIRNLTGNHQAVKLPDGLYKVRLQIGKYQTEKQITVQAGQQIKPYFQAKIGRIQVSADHLVDWEITGPDNVVYKIANKQSVNEILPVGKYQVKAMLPALAQQQMIHVQPDKHITKHLKVPLGKVNLMAIRDNQPLLEAIEWEVFRLEKNHRYKIGEYHLHSRSINVPPGQYEAVAHHQGKISKRRFLVQKKTTNKVVLVME